MLLNYLIVFLVGGGICLIGQILVIRTNMTTTRILVLFLLLGVFLEAIGVYDYIVDFAKAGATIPISGFGSTLAKGAIEGAKTGSLLEIIKGGLSSTSAGISAAVFFSYIFAMIFSSRSKNFGK